MQAITGAKSLNLSEYYSSSSSVDSATYYEKTNAQRMGKPRFRRVKSNQAKNGSDQMTHQ